jgi:uncharacterized membrane-anchored protein
VRDLTDPRLMYMKAGLLLLAAVLAGVGVLMEAPTARVLVLLLICVWASCRVYYFLFYVIEKYIDPGARFAGVGDAVAYVLGGRGRRRR